MAAIRDIGEFGLIDRLARLAPCGPGVIEGIGDDCAVLRFGEQIVLVSTDLFLEDVHFRRAYAPAFDIGWKAAAASLSDVAAMGGAPRHCLVSLGCPPETDVTFIEEIYRGMSAALSEHNVAIVGGDTTRAPARVLLDVTVLGEPSMGRYLCRKGARVGDVLAVTGCCGSAAAGLHALELGRGAPELVQAHLRPRPRIAEGQWLCGHDAVHAMIDVSDGLLQDAGHLARSNGLGVDVAPDAVPIARPLESYCAEEGLDPLDFAFTGGEDYELALALDPAHASEIVRTFCRRFPLSLTPIGVFTDAFQGPRLDGTPPARPGFNHFA